MKLQLYSCLISDLNNCKKRFYFTKKSHNTPTNFYKSRDWDTKLSLAIYKKFFAGKATMTKT